MLKEALVELMTPHKTPKIRAQLHALQTNMLSLIADKKSNLVFDGVAVISLGDDVVISFPGVVVISLPVVVVVVVLTSDDFLLSPYLNNPKFCIILDVLLTILGRPFISGLS